MKSVSTHRRKFLKTTVIGAACVIAAPNIVTASRTNAQIIIGEKEHQFEVLHQFPQLPSQYTWQTTHNVAVDAANNLYVIHEGRENQKDHPSIFVFDENGKFIRAFGQRFQGGGHGLEVRKEGSQEFLYVTGYQQVKEFAKLDLKGEVVWVKRAPKESGVYHADEAEKPAKVWGDDRFLPTNFAFLPDGGFYLADGYGSNYIHRFDKDAKWISSFGGKGKGEGKFNTAHGLWIDDRNPAAPKIVVTDRAHNTLQIFNLNGGYEKTIPGFGLPANIDKQGDLLLVSELVARVSILDKEFRTIVQLGSDVERLSADTKKAIRGDEKQWQDGKFVHPHDACFDNKGNIYVAEWVQTGRVTKLKKVT